MEAFDVLGVHHSDDAVQVDGALQGVVHPQRRDDGPRVGEPCGTQITCGVGGWEGGTAGV